MAKIIEDQEVGELWERYKPLKGEATADLVLSLIVNS